MIIKSLIITPTPMDTANLVEIICIFDEFCKYFEIELKNM